MARPILNYNDSRVKKIWHSHGCLCRKKTKQGEYQYMFFNLDNLPDRDIWQRLGVARLAISGKTISEAIYLYNKELQNVRITGRKKSIPKQVRTIS